MLIKKQETQSLLIIGSRAPVIPTQSCAVCRDPPIQSPDQPKDTGAGSWDVLVQVGT